MKCHGLQVDSNAGIVGVPTSFKNKLINGNFDIWQRGYDSTSIVQYTSYLVDRWAYYVNGTILPSVNSSRQEFTPGQTSVPGEPAYFVRSGVITANSTDEEVTFAQRIEGVATFSGETVTVSFYAKADSTINSAVEFYQNFGSGGSSAVNAIGTTTISLTTSWTRYTVTADIPSISGKTVGTSSHFDLVFWLSGGSSFDSRNNSLGNQSIILDLAKVQLEKGHVATEFEIRNPNIERLLCYRYFYATPTVGAGVYNTETQFGCPINPFVPFRTTPSATTKSGGYTNINIEHDDTADISAIALGWTGAGKFEVNPAIYLTVPTRSGYQGLSGVVLMEGSVDEFWFDAEL